MNYENQVTRGVNRDLAPERMRPDTARDMRNLRLVTVDGQGLLVTSVAGNEEAFQLSSGFVPLGYTVFRDVAFIWSLNPATGEGEIGCFPSPIDPVTGGFQRVYAPLQNFTGTTDPDTPGVEAGDFRSTCLDLECGRQIEAQARISYDNSVELFWTDYENPLRHVSCGFDIDTGASTNRLYWHGNDGGGNPSCGALWNQINVFFETCVWPSSSVDLVDGGSVKAGNWFFYVRYCRQDLSATSFLTEIGPVQVTSDQATQGVTLDGDEGNTDTGNSVQLTLTGLDTNFTYVQIAYSHHFGGTFETGLINRYYAIEDSGTLEILFNGEEDIVDITAEEIIIPKLPDDVCRTLAQTDNRLWGANWKERIDPAELTTVAQDVNVTAPDPGDLHDVLDWRPGLTQQPYGYKLLQETLSRTGYFRGEPYAFGVVFVYADGKTSQPFPVTGVDLYPGGGGGTNVNGILRFPMHDTHPLYDGTNVKVMGVEFDTSGATIPPELESRLCGFYFVRAERKAQLVYQGPSFTTWRIEQGSPPGTYPTIDNILPTGWGSGFELDSTREIPMFRGIWTGLPVPDIPTRLSDSGIDLGVLGGVGVVPRTDRGAILSSDHFFLGAFTDNDYTLVRAGTVTWTVSDQGGDPTNDARPCTLYDQSAYVGQDVTVPGAVQGGVSMVNVAGYSSASINGFTSFFQEAGSSSDLNIAEAWFYKYDNNQEIGNRQIRIRRYLGCEKAGLGTWLHQPSDTTSYLVNVYRADPTGQAIANLYDPGVELYYRIGEFHPIGDWGGTFIEYGGDCFLMRTYHAECTDAGYHDGDEVDDDNGRRYVWGNLYGVITECTVNTAMRYAEGSRNYYPEYNPTTPKSFMLFGGSDHDLTESDLYDKGYQRVLDLRGTLGYDTVSPANRGVYPTRVRYSDVYVNSSTARDGYLSWGLDNKRDYDHSRGEIMRLGMLGGNLYSVHRHAIRRHFISERAMGTTEQGGAFVLGTGDVLSEQSQVISAQYGTQHQWSFIQTDRAFYGYDQHMRTIWRFGADGLTPLSDVRGFQADVYASTQVRTNDPSDAVSRTGDAPVCQEGVVGFYDKKHQEVGWSFLWLLQANEGDENDIRYSETLVYNEALDVYSGKRYSSPLDVTNGQRPHSPFYITLNEDLFSMDPADAPWDGPTSGAGFWHHDRNTDHSTFWGVNELAKLSVIVNANPGIPKLYDHGMMAGSDATPLRLDFSTEYQRASLDPFTGNPSFWLEPRYKENAWHYTVPKTTAVIPGSNQEYGIRSPMRGKWMQVDAFWLTQQSFNVQSLWTNIRQSLQ